MNQSYTNYQRANPRISKTGWRPADAVNVCWPCNHSNVFIYRSYVWKVENHIVTLVDTTRWKIHNEFIAYSADDSVYRCIELVQPEGIQ